MRTVDFVPSDIPKKCPRIFSDHANETSMFVRDGCDAECCFVLPRPASSLNLSSKEFADASGPRARAPVGSAASPWRSSRSPPGAFRMQPLKGTRSSISIATRRHDATTQRRNSLETVDLSTGPSFGHGAGPSTLLFFVSHGRFRRVVVSLAPSRQTRTCFCVQRCDERRRRSEVIL